jgi:hypothetical protein
VFRLYSYEKSEARSAGATLSKEADMDLDQELLARIRAAASLKPGVKVRDFQVRAGENGSVLINLKTGKAELVYDDDSDLHDLEDLHLSEADGISQPTSSGSNSSS